MPRNGGSKFRSHERKFEERNTPGKQREAEVFDRVNEIAQQAFEHATEKATIGFDLEQALIELEDERRMAMASYPAQVGTAVRATMGKAELVGLRKTVVGSPEDFENAKSQDEILGKIERRRGPKAVKLFQQFVEQMKKLEQEDDDMPMIEHRGYGNGRDDE